MHTADRVLDIYVRLSVRHTCYCVKTAAPTIKGFSAE